MAGSIEVCRSRAISGMSTAPISIRSANPLGDNFAASNLDFAKRIEPGGIDFASRNAGAAKSLPILLEQGEYRVGEHARALFDQYVIVTDTIEAVHETGKCSAGFS